MVEKVKYGKQEERRNRWMSLDGVSGGELRRKKRMERLKKHSDLLLLVLISRYNTKYATNA